jgi:hypothetical protein
VRRRMEFLSVSPISSLFDAASFCLYTQINAA